MAAIISLLVIVVLSLLVTRIAAMALIMTGLSSESAKFQAWSAFTGVGFTTKESEIVVNHPVRRRIIVALMMLGNVGVATVMASVILSAINTARADHWGLYLLTLAAGGFFIVALFASRWVEHRMNHLISWCLTRWTRMDVKDYVALLQLKRGYAVNDLTVEAGDWLAGKTLLELSLPKEGVLVLGVERADGQYVGTPRAEDRIEAGDTVVLYGAVNRLAELDQRKAGADGDASHLQAVEDQKKNGAQAIVEKESGL